MAVVNFEVNPIAWSLYSIDIRWYGVMYLLAFLLAYLLLNITRKTLRPPLDSCEVDDLIFYAAIGVIFGGRVGFILIYYPSLMLSDLLQLLTFWQPGRAFHGGLVGVILAVAWFCHRKKRNFWAISDYVAPVAAIGVGFGRVGNLLNGELWGRPTDGEWGIIFANLDNIARHPSQIYEAFLEGFGLALLLFLIRKKTNKVGLTSVVFLAGYALARFVCEFYREPDFGARVGFVGITWMTIGQLLSIIMLCLAVGLFFYLRRKYHARIS